MNGAISNMATTSFHSALTPFAMQFGIVPNGIKVGVENELIVFGQMETQQIELQPMINMDGTVEDAGRIVGFPPPAEDVILERGEGLLIPSEVWSYDFYRDWKFVSGMMDTRIGDLVAGRDREIDGKKKGLPDGLVPTDDSMWDSIAGDVVKNEKAVGAPDVSGFEEVTLRDLLGKLHHGSADRSKLMVLGGHLFDAGRMAENYLIAANLFFGAGVLLMGLGNSNTAMVSLGSAAVRLPETHATARAIILEMSAQAMETQAARAAAAKQWHNSLTNDADNDSRVLRLLRGMWSAWSAGELGEMRELMQYYTVMMQRKGNHLEAAKGCVRAAWLFSETVERNGEGEDSQLRIGASALLGIAGDLFKRGGDEGTGMKAKGLADMA